MACIHLPSAAPANPSQHTGRQLCILGGSSTRTDPALLRHSTAHPKMLRASRGWDQHIPRAHSSHQTDHNISAVQRKESLFPPSNNRHHPALRGSFAGGAEHRAGPQHTAFAHTGCSVQTEPLLVIFPALAETQHFRLRAQVSEPLRAEVCDGNDDTPPV